MSQCDERGSERVAARDTLHILWKRGSSHNSDELRWCREPCRKSIGCRREDLLRALRWRFGHGELQPGSRPDVCRPAV